MLKVDPSLNHIPARRETIVALMESINQPLVNIPGHGTASTGAFIMGTRNPDGYFTMYVYLHQPETKAVIIYVSEPRSLTVDQYRAEEEEAQRFVESMGFMMDDIRFPALNVPEQESVISRVPLFRPPERTVDLFEVADSRDVEPHSDPGIQDDAAFFGDGPSGMGSSLPTSGPSFDEAPSSGASVLRGSPVSGPGLTGPGPQSGGRLQGVPISGRPISGQPMTGPSSSGHPRTGPGSTGPSDPRTTESMKRIGRLLGTFGVLLGMGLGGCATPSDPEEASPKDRATTAQLDLAAQHLARGAPADAVKVYEGVLRKTPRDKDALRGLGLAYLNLDRLDDAERYLSQAVEADPNWSMPKNELAVVHLQQGRCAEAQALLVAVLDDIFYPTPAYARHNLAKAQACQGDLTSAIETLESAVKLQPTFCLGYLTLSEMTQRQDAHEATISACARFIEFCEGDERVRPNILPQHSATCYRRTAAAYAKLGDVESARSSLKRCLNTGALEASCREMLRLLPP
ncbi:MAG: tetratricopeptide repeat protein [Myxococcota bacterium]